MVSALQRASSSPQASARLFVAQVESALQVYLVTCPEIDTPRSRSGGRLPPWKLQRVKVLMESQILGGLCVTHLARECGLSVRHFTRAFTLTTGLNPRRYLLKLRVERARRWRRLMAQGVSP